MAGSTWGIELKMTTWGESHGKGIGVVVDGCPAGLSLSEEDIQRYLDRRKPGSNPYGTKRTEEDQAQILSGVFEGKTTGTPISILVENTDERPHDYSDIKDIYRPGHADYTYDAKYGIRDYRGGGRSSGRETVGRTAAGAVAAKLLESLGITVKAYTVSIGPVKIDRDRFDEEEIFRNPLCMPDKEAADKAAEYLDEKREECDSVGGIVECVVEGLPAGVGEPVFDKLDARLASAVMSVGAVKGVEIGDGFAAALSTGSENNDEFCKDGKLSNHAGGILGGISDGSPVILRAAFKPTPSISRPQRTIDNKGEERTISIKGRHDSIIVPRAVVVVEAMTAFTVADLLLVSLGSRLDVIEDILKKETS